MAGQIEVNKRNVKAQQCHIVSNDTASKRRAFEGLPIKQASLNVGEKAKMEEKLPSTRTEQHFDKVKDVNQVGDDDGKGGSKCCGASVLFEAVFPE